MQQKNYLDINRKLWNSKTDVHISSDFYDLEAFKAGKTSLKATELALLGDIRGKRILHLQCHFGQDTLSLARMGAVVTGVDLSDRAIEYARSLNEELGLDARFICGNVLDLPTVLEGEFDLVFTSYGVLGWLPDLDAWARVVAHFLKPKGQLILVEFHPMLWMFSEDFSYFKYAYFKSTAIVEIEEGTYADTSAPIENQCVVWQYSLGETVTALLAQGLELKLFKEYDFSPYNCFAKAVPTVDGNWQVQGMEGKLPLIFAIVTTKK